MDSTLEKAISALRTSTNIAVVGLSRYPGKPAHDIPMLLSRRGYNIVGVNPHAAGVIEGITVYTDLLEVPFEIDIVNVFRPSHDADAVIDAALDRHDVEGDVSTIWLQEGIVSRQGAEKCAEAGITYIEDACIYVVYQYLRI